MLQWDGATNCGIEGFPELMITGDSIIQSYDGVHFADKKPILEDISKYQRQCHIFEIQERIIKAISM